MSRSIWLLLALAVAMFEGYALGAGRVEWTLTYTIRMLRFDPIARFMVLPLGTWLVWHWLLRPARIAVFTGFDVLAFIIGIGWAIYEAKRGL